MDSLEFPFNPSNVAVIGVSDDPNKLGSVLFSNLLKAGFKGKIFPVNPNYTELFDRKSYSKVTDIPENVDLACIVIPAKFVKAVMEECALKKVKGVIIIAAGFKEVGGEGVEMENEIKRIAKENNIRILGPNCLGAIVPGNNVNASFAASQPIDGNIAFLSQSGAICTAVLDLALERSVGFSHFISFGNKVDINENDLIEVWLTDEKVKVIGGYIEEISDGYELIKKYNEFKANKPLIILKPGESMEAKKAMTYHTGAMAGPIKHF